MPVPVCRPTRVQDVPARDGSAHLDRRAASLLNALTGRCSHSGEWARGISLHFWFGFVFITSLEPPGTPFPRSHAGLSKALTHPLRRIPCEGLHRAEGVLWAR